MLSKMRDYQKLDAKDSRIIRSRLQDGLESQLLVIQTPFGYRRVGELFRPEGNEKLAAILYVHWYEPESRDSNRSQFVEEAKELAHGVLAGSLDQRPKHYVIMAATPRFLDWYLYLPKLEGEAREMFIQQMAEIDPIVHAPNLASASVFFQFGTDDPHVPRERAEEFFAATREPKALRWYESGHGLNEAATNDRKIWLKEKLGLK